MIDFDLSSLFTIILDDIMILVDGFMLDSCCIHTYVVGFMLYIKVYSYIFNLNCLLPLVAETAKQANPIITKMYNFLINQCQQNLQKLSVF
jgi:hypothetical protein